MKLFSSINPYLWSTEVKKINSLVSTQHTQFIRFFSASLLCLTSLNVWSQDLVVETSTLPNRTFNDLIRSEYATSVPLTVTVSNLDFSAGLPTGTAVDIRVWYDNNNNGLYDNGTDTEYELRTITLAIDLDPAGQTNDSFIELFSIGNPPNTLVATDFRDDLIYATVDPADNIVEIDENNNESNTGLACRIPIEINGLEVQCQYQSNANDNVISNPAVMDVDADGISEVFFTASDSIFPNATLDIGAVVAINGDDCSEIWRTADDVTNIGTHVSVGRLGPGTDPLPGADPNAYYVVAKNSILRATDGSLVSNLINVQDPGIAAAPYLVDLDEDGRSEIIIGRDIFNNDGTLRFSFAAGSIATQPTTSTTTLGSIPVVADVDQNGVLDVVLGNRVFTSFDGTLSGWGTGQPDPVVLWSTTSYTPPVGGAIGITDGWNAIYDHENDGTPELVLSSRQRLTILNAETGDVVDSIANQLGASLGGFAGGPPVVGNIIGSSVSSNEIALAGATAAGVYSFDGGNLSKVACYPNFDNTSGITGVSVIDINADGINEVFYRDQQFLRVLGDESLNPLCQVPQPAIPVTSGCGAAEPKLCLILERAVGSVTLTEYPVVADVDNDESAEVLIGSDALGGAGSITPACDNSDADPNNDGNCVGRGGLYIFRDSTTDGLEKWVDTRNIWNQHAYSITHVNNDGSIPSGFTPSWIAHNTFRLNLPEIGDGLTPAPDLSVTRIRAAFSSATTLDISARIGNAGSRIAAAGVSVAYYDADPLIGGALIGTGVTTTAISPGSFEDVTIAYVVPPGFQVAAAEVWAAVDDDGTLDGTNNLNGAISECFETDPVFPGPPSSPLSSTPNNVVGGPLAGITIDKDDGGLTATIGQNIAYTISVENVETSRLDPVTVTDVIPAGLSFVSGMGSGWACSEMPPGTVSCAYDDVSNGPGLDTGEMAEALTLTFAIPSGYSGANPIVNTATATGVLVGGSGPDNEVTDSDLDDTPLGAVTDLTVTKDDGSLTYTPGETATYVITVTNAGPSDANAVEVTDTLPAGVTLSAPVTCSSAGLAACSVPSTGVAGDGSFMLSGNTIPVGGGNSLVLSVPVDFDIGMTTDPLVNTAVATDPNDLTDNQGEDSNMLLPPADINVSKTVDAGADGIASAGETVTYSITFTNTGGIPQNYAAGDIGENVPANTIHAGGDDFTCAAVTAGSACFNTNAFSVPAGGSFVLTYLVTVDDPLAAGVISIANSVTVPGECPNAGGSANDCDVVIETQPGITVFKTVDAGTDGIASAGETITYSITFNNTGGSVQNYAVGDIGETVPPNTTHAGGDDFTCSAVTAGGVCSNTAAFSVPAGGSFVLTYLITVDDPLPAGVLSVANTVTVPSECPNVGTVNECDVVVGTEPQISVFKTVDAGADGIASAGEMITYFITFNNTGGSVQSYAAGEVGETVPANTTHAGGDDFTCAAVAAGSVCSNTGAFSVPVGGSFVLTYLVTVDIPLPAGVSSIANAVTVPGECPNVGTANECDVVVVVTPQDPTPAPTLGFWAMVFMVLMLMYVTWISLKIRKPSL